MEMLESWDRFVCKIATKEEILKRFDYEISIHSDGEKNNWLMWKDECVNMPEWKRISYFGFLDDFVICEATAAISSDACQNMEDLIDDKTAYLFAFRTNIEFRWKWYFSKLFNFMVDDLKSRWYEQAILWVEPNEIENKKIYFHYGFNKYLKTGIEKNPDGTKTTVEYYKKYL